MEFTNRYIYSIELETSVLGLELGLDLDLDIVKVPQRRG